MFATAPFIEVDDENIEKEEKTAVKDAKLEKEKAATEKSEKKKLAEESKEKTEKELTVDEKLEKVVNDTLGDKTNTKKDRVHKIEVYGEVANVWMNANENLTVKLTKAGIWSDTFEVIEELAEFNEIALFQLVWMLPLTDTYGNVSDEKVMMLDFPREIIDKINFANVDYNKASAIAENYWEHNALK